MVKNPFQEYKYFVPKPTRASPDSWSLDPEIHNLISYSHKVLI